MRKLMGIALIGFMLVGVVSIAQAEEEIYNWRSESGIESNDMHKAHLNNINAFPSQPGEIWNWYEEEGVDHPEKIKNNKDYNDPLYKL
tara:strand:- start:30667 stop:30930 length:264 start_codon:yes stop_codon:yes gene_type:complete